MARSTPRPRRRISSRRVWTLKLLGFRYSTSRDAYVLRVIGNQHGPVYQVQRAADSAKRHDVTHSGVS
jgi:hypothetical protein